MTRPLVVFDGSCGFCRKWIERWRQLTGESVDYKPSSEAAPDFPEIPPAEFDRAVQLIRPDRTRVSAAEAVLELTAPHSIAARLGHSAYKKIPLFARATESAYAFVATHRVIFSWLTKILWGASTQKPSFAIANGLFLRLLAFVFLIAFVSFQIQMPGLNGSNGILPVGAFFEAAKTHLGDRALQVLPSLVWLSPTDATLALLANIGIATSLVALLGILQPLCFAILWALMLSLCIAGQDFYSFQWDSLLIETGFLAIFLAPWRLKPNWRGSEPPRLARFAAVFLLFRLMFASGVVKLSSGDPAWAKLEALQYHFFTQPIPNPLAWFAPQLPIDLLTAACAAMFVIELLLPFAFFLPRNPRLVAAWSTIALQIGIALTGNYAFFTLLTIALCLLLLDDRTWPKFLQKNQTPSVFVTRWIRIPVLAAILAISILPLVSSFRTMPPFLAPLAEASSRIAPFRTVNGYGLFAVMTTTRREILVQGSNDGLHWKTYEFPFKPGPLDRPPPFVAPYQPRLDWQMWFAALGRIENNPWFQSLLLRLLQGSPEVLALLETNPFPDAPPKFLRALSDDYTFTRPGQQNWWHSTPAAIYCPQISLRESN
jgi:predicted DCC family thiol-disulfide oxidoreductase YuxK